MIAHTTLVFKLAQLDDYYRRYRFLGLITPAKDEGAPYLQSNGTCAAPSSSRLLRL